MKMQNWLRLRTGNDVSSRNFTVKQRRGFRPRFEALEDRLTPATISISDATAIEGVGTLKYLDRFVTEGSGGLIRPRGSTFGPDGNGDGTQDFYLTSADTNEILRFDSRNGAFMDVFVVAGSGGLNSPGDLAFGPDGMLCVSSLGSGEVLRYDATSGAFVDRIGSNLSTPLGLTFGNDGNLYIAEQGTSRILRFNGSSLSVFVVAGSGGLNEPRQAVFGPDGNLYVASAGNQRVLRYDGQTGAFLNLFAIPYAAKSETSSNS